MKTKYYQCGRVSVYPVDEIGALRYLPKSFAIRGNQKIKKGQFVKVGYLSSTPLKDLLNDLSENRARVVETFDGYPRRLELPSGKIIEVFGLILELLPLIERIWLTIKDIFNGDNNS